MKVYLFYAVFLQILFVLISLKSLKLPLSQRLLSGKFVCIVNFKHIQRNFQHINLMFSLITLDMQLLMDLWHISLLILSEFEEINRVSGKI